jgi:xanthine dehydrogenase molybdenum-binding subunit
MYLPYNGGTWGGGGAYHLEISRLAVIAAKRTDLPVKVICDNDSLFQRPGEALGTYKYKIGYNDDGIIKAVKLDSTFNSAFGDQINKIDKCTKIPNLYCLDTKPYLTRGPIGCFKHGKEASSVMNFVFGHVAAELKMDPGELALLNDGTYQEDWEWVNENVKKRLGFPLDRDSLKECLEIGKNAVDWENKWHEPGTKILPNGNYHGIGLSWQVAWQNAGMRRASAGAYINWDGSLNIQGTRSIVGTNEEMTNAQIICDELGINLEDISFMRHDNVFALASAGNSENLQNNAAWAVRISKQMKQLLCEYAVDPKIPGRPSLFPDKKTEELDVKNSEVYEIANPTNKQPIKAGGATVFIYCRP